MENLNCCPNCMRTIEPGTTQCPYCQFDLAGYVPGTNCLPPFTVLQGKYMVGRVLGHGGFGITYIGWDLNLQTYIAIKEYYPESIVKRDTTSGVTTPTITSDDNEETYRKGLTRYVEEARNLSKFYQLSGIVSVKDFFYENGTGYIVMEYLDGINLKQYLDNSGGKLDEATVLRLMKPVFESMYQIHNAGLVHRDISPDNIMVNSQGQIKLIDFGSARGQSTVVPEATYTVVLKHGYAPPEQYYAKGNQGPWTDIYSLCATMYKMLTGVIPPNSIERMDNDTYVPASYYGVKISDKTENVLKKGLAVKIQDRYQNIGELLRDLYSEGTVMAESGSNMPEFVQNASQTGMGNSSGQIKSMHLSEAKVGNKKAIIGVVAAIAVIIIAIVCILIFGGGDDKRENTQEPSSEKTETPTDASTEGGTTEADSTEQVTEEVPGYEAPTEVSSDWRDYNIKIDDTIYSFPMPYSVWKESGWKATNAPDEVASGNMEFIYCENGSGYEITVIVINYQTSSQPIEDCYVAGVSFSSYEDFTGLDVEIAGGIKLYESNADEVKTALGAPDYIYEGTDDFEYMYYGDDEEDGIDIEFTSDNIINGISMINTTTPEGVEIDPSSISQEVPEINSLYTAPGALSEQFTDCTFILDSKIYQLPCPVSEFVADGWSVDTAAPDYIAGNSTEWSIKLQKGGNSIEVNITNYTADSILPANGYVTTVNVESSYCGLYFESGGGLVLGESTTGDVEEVLKGENLEYSIDEYSTFTSIYVYVDDYEKGFNMYAEPDTGILNEITLENEPDTIR